MSKPNDGGPAFAQGTRKIYRDKSGFLEPEHGMSLRDHFAAKAIPIMWDAYDKGYCGLNGKDEPNVKIIAEGAYQLADAMLKARES